MSTFKGTIAKQPIVKEKVIFSAIKLPDSNKPIQLVLFKSTVDKNYADLLATLNLNDEITVAGKMQKNKLNNETEISIAEIYKGEYNPPKDKYAVDPEVDFKLGSETEYGVIQLVERVGKKSYYTDGEMFWYEDSDLKCPCSF